MKNSPFLREGHQRVRVSGTNALEKWKRKSGPLPEKVMTEALSMVKLSSQVFRVFTMTTNNKTETERNVAEVSAWAVCPLLATALKMTVDHLPSDIFTDIMNSLRPVDSNVFFFNWKRIVFDVFCVPSTLMRYKTFIFIEDAYIWKRSPAKTSAKQWRHIAWAKDGCGLSWCTLRFSVDSR